MLRAHPAPSTGPRAGPAQPLRGVRGESGAGQGRAVSAAGLPASSARGVHPEAPEDREGAQTGGDDSRHQAGRGLLVAPAAFREC